MTTLAMKPSLTPFIPGWNALEVTGKSGAPVLPTTNAFHAGSTQISSAVVVLLPPSKVEYTRDLPSGCRAVTKASRVAGDSDRLNAFAVVGKFAELVLPAMNAILRLFKWIPAETSLPAPPRRV